MKTHLNQDEIQSIILKHLETKGCMGSLKELAIYRKDTLATYAAFFCLLKEGKIKEVNGISYLA